MLVVVGPDVEQVGGTLLQARFGYWRMVENVKGVVYERAWIGGVGINNYLRIFQCLST